MMPSQQHGEKESELAEQIEHVKRLNKLTPKAKTDFILQLQNEADIKSKVIFDLHEQIDKQEAKYEHLKTEHSTLNIELGRKDREINQLKDAYIDKLELIVELYEGKV